MEVRQQTNENNLERFANDIEVLEQNIEILSFGSVGGGVFQEEKAEFNMTGQHHFYPNVSNGSSINTA